MKKVLFLTLGLIISFSCSQRPGDMIMINTPISFATVIIKTEAGKVESTLRLSKLSIQVEIVGNIVTTTMDMSFYNDLDRILEGTLNFPLENEQVVSRFAMEVNGDLREGVVVEKAKGRRVFEEIVRRKVDPGLLEMTKGNNFRARVYPIPAKGNKRIVISYEEELDMNETAWSYRLPLGFQEKVASFSLDINIKKQVQRPQLIAASFPDFNFKANKSDGYKATFEAKNFLPDQSIEVRIPFPKSDKHFVMTEKAGKETYFYLHTRLTPIVKKAPKPKKITLAWDVSESSKGRDIDKELALLDQYFKRLENAKIELVEFSNTVHNASIFNLKGGNWLELKTKIQGLTYDGGTQLGSINLKKYKSDLVILVTDGLTTFGKSKLAFAQTPIITLNSSKSANEAYLKYISQVSGGKYIDLNHTKIGNLTTALTNESYQFINATYDGKKITSTYPNIVMPVHNQFSLAGVLKNETAKITLNFGIGNNVFHTETIEINATKNASKFDIQRLWAKKKINVLNMQSELFEEEITALGKKHSLVTPYTSLIVLETVDDYAMYEIEPPAEFKKRYEELIAEKVKKKEKSIAEREMLIKNELNNLKKWWSTTYLAEKIKKKPILVEPIAAAEPEPEPVIEVVANEPNVFDELEDCSYNIKVDQGFSGTEDCNKNDGTIIITASGTGKLEYSIDGGSDWRSSVYESETSQEIPRTTGSPPPPPPSPSDQSEMEMEEVEKTETETIPVETSNNSNQNRAPIVVRKVEKKATIEFKKAQKENYIKELEAHEPAKRYQEYLKLKSEGQTSAAFFLEVGQSFLKAGDQKTAMRVLSNIAEMDLENREFLKILANQLSQMKEYDLALLLHQEIVRIREEEPQAYRDLGLAYVQTGDYQLALDIYYDILTKDWAGNESRFKGIKGIVLMEMNNLITNHKKNLDISNIPKSWIKALPVDIRIVMNWSSDATDVDLWITDPSGEKCSYNNQLTSIGGRISNDMTDGYGPEEFLLKKAHTGEYKIEADFYGTNRQTVERNVTVDIQFFTHFGKPNQKVEEITVTLRGVKEVVNVGTVKFGD